MKELVTISMALLFILMVGCATKHDRASVSEPDDFGEEQKSTFNDSSTVAAFELEVAAVLNLQPDEEITKSLLTVSPDGRWLLLRENADYRGLYSDPQMHNVRIEVYTLNKDGYQLHRTLELDHYPIHDWGLSWSPDNNYLIYCADNISTLGYESHLYLLDPASGEIENLTGEDIVVDWQDYAENQAQIQTGPQLSRYNPIWLEDGVYFIQTDYRGPSNWTRSLRCLDVDTKQSTQVQVFSEGLYDGFTPTAMLPSRDGSFYAAGYLQNTGGISRIDGEGVTLLTEIEYVNYMGYEITQSEYSFYYALDVSKDGSRILYCCDNSLGLPTEKIIVCIDAESGDVIDCWDFDLISDSYLTNAIFDPNGEGVLLFSMNIDHTLGSIHYLIPGESSPPALLHEEPYTLGWTLDYGLHPDGGYRNIFQTRWTENGLLVIGNSESILRIVI